MFVYYGLLIKRSSSDVVVKTITEQPAYSNSSILDLAILFKIHGKKSFVRDPLLNRYHQIEIVEIDQHGPVHILIYILFLSSICTVRIL